MRDAQGLLQADLAFIQAFSWPESHCTVERYPEVLTNHSEINAGWFQGLLL
jgi:hypothetical protein